MIDIHSFTPAFFSGMTILYYLGPEAIMPLASVLAAIVGVLLIFWRYIVGFFRRIFRSVTGKADPEASLDDEMPISESIISDQTEQDE